MTQPELGEPHLAYQLRRLADTLAAHPDRTQVQRNAERLLLAGVLLWTRGGTALARSAQWSGPWSTGGSGPTGKGGHSDPTGSAALDGYPEGDDQGHGTPDTRRRSNNPERRYHLRLTTAIGYATDNATDIIEVITAALTKPSTPRPTDECTEIRCDDTAEPGRQGRCPACAKWRQRWLTDHPNSTRADIPPVPAHVIDERRVRRRRRTA